MEKPVMAGKAPIVIDIEAGEYEWCACGRSSDQPFCDGSHEGTAFSPVSFAIETSRKVALCLCKQTGTAPFCDGTHKRVREESGQD